MKSSQRPGAVSGPSHGAGPRRSGPSSLTAGGKCPSTLPARPGVSEQGHNAWTLAAAGCSLSLFWESPHVRICNLSAGSRTGSSARPQTKAPLVPSWREPCLGQVSMMGTQVLCDHPCSDLGIVSHPQLVRMSEKLHFHYRIPGQIRYHQRRLPRPKGKRSAWARCPPPTSGLSGDLRPGMAGRRWGKEAPSI